MAPSPHHDLVHRLLLRPCLAMVIAFRTTARPGRAFCGALIHNGDSLGFEFQFLFKSAISKRCCTSTLVYNVFIVLGVVIPVAGHRNLPTVFESWRKPHPTMFPAPFPLLGGHRILRMLPATDAGLVNNTPAFEHRQSQAVVPGMCGIWTVVLGVPERLENHGLQHGGVHGDHQRHR